MEGHHLIPLTVKNSLFFKQKYNINLDCTQNLVSLCPNCHQSIHYGNNKARMDI